MAGLFKLLDRRNPLGDKEGTVFNKQRTAILKQSGKRSYGTCNYKIKGEFLCTGKLLNASMHCLNIVEVQFIRNLLHDSNLLLD